MAITYHNSASNPSDNGTLASSPTSITPPGSMSAGQIVLVWASMRNGSGTIAVSNTGGQSWNSIQADGTTSNITSYLLWCKFNGSWTGGDPSFTFSSVSATTLVMHVFTPTSSTYEWAVDQSMTILDLSANNAGPYTITGQNTTQASTVTLAAWMTADDNSWTSLTGTGWVVTGGAQYRNLDGSDTSMSFAHKIQTSSGATGNPAKSQVTVTNDAVLTGIITFYEFDPGAVFSPVDPMGMSGFFGL